MLALMVILGVTISTYAAIYMTTYAVTTLKLLRDDRHVGDHRIRRGDLGGCAAGGWLSDLYGRKPRCSGLA